MRNVLKCAVAAASFWLATLAPGFAQSSCLPLVTRAVLTAAQWQQCFQSKNDFLNFTPLNQAGGVMSGRLITAQPGASLSGLNLTPGSAPASPANGDVWATSTGLFVQINGATVGPLSSAAAGSFAATSPVTVGFGGGLTTYACPTCGVIGSPLSQFASTTSAQLAGIISDESGSGALLFGTSPTIASPTFSGTFAGTYTIAGTPTLSGTFAGNPTFSGTNTFSGALNFTGLGTSGTCSHSVLLTSIGVAFEGACPGAAASIQAGSGGTTITGTCSSGFYLVDNGGTLGCVPNTLPTTCVILSTSATTCSNGSSQANNGTYTPSANVRWIEVEVVGGGSGGGGEGSGTGSTAGTASSFGTSLLAANGGASSSDAGSGAGGTASGGNVLNLTGGQGQCGVSTIGGGSTQPGGTGGVNVYGGAGIGGAIQGNPTPAQANTGAGGGGGSASGPALPPGCGGSAGGAVRHIITSLLSSYLYVVGPGGAGAAGVQQNGAAGAAGRITIIEHYGS